MAGKSNDLGHADLVFPGNSRRNIPVPAHAAIDAIEGGVTAGSNRGWKPAVLARIDPWDHSLSLHHFEEAESNQQDVEVAGNKGTSVGTRKDGKNEKVYTEVAL